MQKIVLEYIEPYLQDELFENEMRQYLQVYDKLIMYSPTCSLCGGFGHESDLKCGFVKTFIKAFKIMRKDAEVNQLKKELKFLLNNRNRFEFGLHKQQRQSENNEAQVESVLLQDDSSESSNSKAKKLANKLRRKSDQAHKMAINTSDCLLDEVEQRKADGISKNYRKRRLIKLCDLSMDDS